MMSMVNIFTVTSRQWRDDAGEEVGCHGGRLLFDARAAPDGKAKSQEYLHFCSYTSYVHISQIHYEALQILKNPVASFVFSSLNSRSEPQG